MARTKIHKTVISFKGTVTTEIQLKRGTIQGYIWFNFSCILVE